MKKVVARIVFHRTASGRVITSVYGRGNGTFGSLAEVEDSLDTDDVPLKREATIPVELDEEQQRLWKLLLGLDEITERPLFLEMVDEMLRRAYLEGRKKRG